MVYGKARNFRSKNFGTLFVIISAKIAITEQIKKER